MTKTGIVQRGGRRPALSARRVLPAVLLCALAAPMLSLGASSSRPASAALSGWTAYVVLQGTNSIVPVDTTGNAVGTPIPLSPLVSDPVSIAINPTATTAYVTDFQGNVLTPIDLTTAKALPLIPMHGSASGGAENVALTPSDSTALVSDDGNESVDLVDVATGTETTSVPISNGPAAVAVLPDGAEAYAGEVGACDCVIPIDLATATAGSPITVGAGPAAMVVNWGGTDLYVANYETDSVSVVATATNTAAATIPVGTEPDGLAISPDGGTLYVANAGSNSISVIDTASDTVTATIPVGARPDSLALTPDGAHLYVPNSGSDTVSVINTSTNTVGATVTVGASPVAVAITPDQAPVAALHVTPGAAGTPTTFDASSSTVPFGTVASYRWDFGDTSPQVVTTSPTTTHTYAKAGTYPVLLTETSAGGTATESVFTGQAKLRNGGESAATSTSVTVPAATITTTPTTPGPDNSTVTPAHHPAASQTFPGLKLPPGASPLLPAVQKGAQRAHAHKTDPLRAVPASGTPGLDVSLTDRRLTTSCGQDHTVYVFFDNQLVTQSQAAGRGFADFSDTDVVVPGDAGPGHHRFELSCTDVDPWIASTPFAVTESTNHTMGWVTSLPHSGNLDTRPATWAKAAGISVGLLALLLVYLLGFPAEWFNDTYDANQERIMAAARRRFPRLLAARDPGQVSRRRRAASAVALFAGFVAIAALIQCFLEPKFGWNPSSLWLFLGWCGGVAIVTLGFQLPSVAFGVRAKHRVAFRVLVGSIVVAALCVVASRLFSLEPGYCYGLIAVFAFMPELPVKSSGRLAALSSLFVLALSLVAWIILLPVNAAAAHAHPSPALLVLQAGLGVVFILGIESVSFGMLPLPFLPGRDVAAWNRWAWAGVFGLGLVAFIWTLLQPGNGVTSAVKHVDLIPVAATCGAFAVFSLAFMAYFKLRKPTGAPEEDDAAPVGLVG